jgi:hypothetical protein
MDFILTLAADLVFASFFDLVVAAAAAYFTFKAAVGVINCLH